MPPESSLSGSISQSCLFFSVRLSHVSTFPWKAKLGNHSALQSCALLAYSFPILSLLASLPPDLGVSFHTMSLPFMVLT